LLALGFVCNLLVKPVAAKWFMGDDQLAAERKRAHDFAAAGAIGGHAVAARASPAVLAVWILVGIPILWGVWLTLRKVTVLFH